MSFSSCKFFNVFWIQFLHIININPLIQRQRVSTGKAVAKAISCVNSPTSSPQRAVYWRPDSSYTCSGVHYRVGTTELGNWSYAWLLPILPSREGERGILSLLWNVSKERSLSLLPQVVSRKRNLSKLYYPGMSPYTNILNWAVNAFTQRTRTVWKHEIFIENYLPKPRLCLLNGVFHPFPFNNYWNGLI